MSSAHGARRLRRCGDRSPPHERFGEAPRAYVTKKKGEVDRGRGGWEDGGEVCHIPELLQVFTKYKHLKTFVLYIYS